MIQSIAFCALTLCSASGKPAQQDPSFDPSIGAFFDEDLEFGVTRQDLAEAVQDVDMAFWLGRRLPATEEHSALAETNLAFDAITKTFFSLNLVGALEELVTMRAELLGPKWEPFPSTVSEAKVDGVWVRQNRRPRWSDAPAWPWRSRMRIRTSTTGDLFPSAMGPEVIQGAPLRVALTKRLDTIEETEQVATQTAAQLAGMRAIRRRLKLRWDAPSQAKTAEFLMDPVTYEASLLSEVEALERGEDPYAMRFGDHWRTFVHGRRDLATRVYRANSCPKSGMPLVIAFHGAGGDENFFFEIAGNGHLKALAGRHGVLVVAPFTVDYLSSKKAFESLLAGIELAYDFDEEQVFILGHSLGAIAVSKLCSEVPERLTAAACIAGFTEHEFDETLPIHVLSGELDAIVPFQFVKGGAESAAKGGAQVRFTPMKDQGHTLLLPAALDLVFEDWFGSK